MKSCMDFLASAGHSLKEDDQILYILAGLGSEYDLVVVSTTTRFEPFSTNDLRALLLSFEARLDRNPSSTHDMSLPSVNLTQRRPSSPRSNQTLQPHNNYNSNVSRGGRGSNRGRGRFNPNRSLQCQICGKQGRSEMLQQVQQCLWQQQRREQLSRQHQQQQ